MSVALLSTVCGAALLAATGGATEGGDVWRVLLLRDYNTRVVVAGVTLLGAASGLIGTFMLLRKRALLGDALSHATLPGIGIAFIVMTSLGGTGKALPGLLLGATVAGALGVLTILAIVNLSRIKEDAALGIVLSVFFGLGIAILGLVQNMDTGHAAGLTSFIYGKTASMLLADAQLIAVAAALIGLLCVLLFKEFGVLCFDPQYARAQGWPVVGLDVALMALVVGVTVIGLQAVGLILMIALLVIPPAAARFWVHRLAPLLVVSALIGAVSGLVGAASSALLPRLPAGAVIVMVAGAVFVVSLVFGSERGVLRRVLEHWRLTRRIALQNLLRALYELTETGGNGRAVPTTALLEQRSWSAVHVRRVLQRARRAGLLSSSADGRSHTLTPAGRQAGWQVARNHRLWELYLIAHADIAPSHVDRDADFVEHVLEPALVDALEEQLQHTHPDLAAPASPHVLAAAEVAR
jgi:manganese/zinc/iron transport system permease protein